MPRYEQIRGQWIFNPNAPQPPRPARLDPQDVAAALGRANRAVEQVRIERVENPYVVQVDPEIADPPNPNWFNPILVEREQPQKAEENSSMNLKNVKPVDLERVGKPRISRIYRIGIELEGGWDKLPKTNLVPGGYSRIERDGSVGVYKDIPTGLQGKAGIGEIQSPPLPLESWEEWLRDCYPTRVDKSCGLHVHISVRSALTYQRLMDPRYPATILAQFRKWGERMKLPLDNPLWERLDGKSKYCKHQFTADDQVLNLDRDFNHDRRGNRYTVVNYCWSRTGTAECRLLPSMETIDLAISAISELLTTTDKFLLATAEKEKKLKGEGIHNNKGIREVRDVRVRLGRD